MKNQRRRNRSEGFSLIELIVVITIIGILATAVVVNVSGTDDRAKFSRVQADFKSLNQACTLFKLDHNRYPNDLEELVSPPDGGLDSYLESGMPRDPWTQEVYNFELQGNRPRFWSFGSDMTEGQSGDKFTADIDSLNPDGNQ